MKTTLQYIIAAGIGMLPNILYGFTALNWQWWAIVVPFEFLLSFIWIIYIDKTLK